MHTILDRLKGRFPFVTQRPATEDDFYDACLKNDIEVVHTTHVAIGLYVHNLDIDRHFIFLNSRLSGWMLRYVMFHELGHFLFHVPGQTKKGETAYGWTGARKHAEAEAVAAYMLLTVAELERCLLDGEFKRNQRLAELIGLRLDLYHEYGE